MIILGTPNISINLGLTGWLAIIAVVAIGYAFYFRSKWRQALSELADLRGESDSSEI